METITNLNSFVNDLDVAKSALYSDSPSTSISTCNQNQIVTDDNKSTLSNDDKFNLELDKLSVELQVKPQHWTDNYWEVILTKYRWFLHKNEHAGCKICFNAKGFVGKRSQFALMKLYLMNLSYEEFELKLAAHESSEQHKKLKSFLKLTFDNDIGKDIENVNHENAVIEKQAYQYNETYACSLCNKIYRFKKSFESHVQKCKVEKNSDNCNVQNNKKERNGLRQSTIINPVSDRVDVVDPIHEQNNDVPQEMRPTKQNVVLDNKENINFFNNNVQKFKKVRKTENINVRNKENEKKKRNVFRKKTIANCGLDKIIVSTKDVNNNVPYAVQSPKQYTALDNMENINAYNDEDNIVLQLVKPKNQKLKRVLNDAQEIEKTQYEQKIRKCEDDSETGKRFGLVFKDIVFCPICESRFINQDILDKHLDRYHPLLAEIDNIL